MPDIFLDVLYKGINKSFVNSVYMWLRKGVGTYCRFVMVRLLNT